MKLFKYIPIPETLILSIMLITLVISCGCSDKKPKVDPYGTSPSSIVDDSTFLPELNPNEVVYE